MAVGARAGYCTVGPDLASGLQVLASWQLLDVIEGVGRYGHCPFLYMFVFRGARPSVGGSKHCKLGALDVIEGCGALWAFSVPYTLIFRVRFLLLDVIWLTSCMISD
jgi:hypothetical protein